MSPPPLSVVIVGFVIIGGGGIVGINENNEGGKEVVASFAIAVAVNCHPDSSQMTSSQLSLSSPPPMSGDASIACTMETTLASLLPSLPSSFSSSPFSTLLLLVVLIIIIIIIVAIIINWYHDLPGALIFVTNAEFVVPRSTPTSISTTHRGCRPCLCHPPSSSSSSYHCRSCPPLPGSWFLSSLPSMSPSRSSVFA